jgi:hypothetical protein
MQENYDFPCDATSRGLAQNCASCFFSAVLSPIVTIEKDMIANLLSALGGSSDGIVASFLKPELEKHLAGIGTVKSIELDTPNKRAAVTLSMDGDPLTSEKSRSSDTRWLHQPPDAS